MTAKGRPMGEVKVRIKHCTWRDGRPRFTPGPELRALGFRPEILKNPDGTYMQLHQVQAWLVERLALIEERKGAKAAGKPLKPIARGSLYTVENMFEDLWKAQRFDQKSKRKEGRLRERTISDYQIKAGALAKFDAELWTSPIAAVKRSHMKGLHEKLWNAKGLPMANGVMAVLRLAFSHALDRDKVSVNPCVKLKLPTTKPRLRVGTPQEIEALIKAADATYEEEHLYREVGDAILLALYTGQRQADVLALEERNEEGGKIRFIQSKTGARVRVPATPQLLVRLAAARMRKEAYRERVANGLQPIRFFAKGKRVKGEVKAPQIDTVTYNPGTGEPWTSDRFKHVFAELRAHAAKECKSLSTFWFMDLRDTAVTRLALAGCSLAEIASITGHTLESITQIMKHYLELNEAMADAAIAKLQAWMEAEGIAL